MPWVRIDEEFPDHPKVVGAGPLGIAMQVAALCYCNRHLTDGFVPRSTARRLIDLDGLGVTPDEVIAALLKVGMWTPDDGGYRIHDYEKYQFPREEVEARRQAEHDAKAAGGRARAAGAKRDKGRFVKGQVNTRITSSPPAAEPAASQQPTSPVPVTVPPVSTEGSDVTDTSGLKTIVEQARPIDDTTAVFTAWQEATGKHRAHLDDKRRRRIREALKHYPLADILDAVRGWQFSAHHRGQNGHRTVYNDLDLLLRDAAHIEQFRDLARGEGPTAANEPVSWAALREL